MEKHFQCSVCTLYMGQDRTCFAGEVTYFRSSLWSFEEDSRRQKCMVGLHEKESAEILLYSWQLKEEEEKYCVKFLEILSFILGRRRDAHASPNRLETATYVCNYNCCISWSIFYTFYTSGNRNEYSTIYIFNSLMTSQLHHFKRHKSLFHRVKDERWTTLLKKKPTFVSIITLAFLGRFLYFLN